MTKPRVSVIVVTHESEDFIEACLRSIPAGLVGLEHETIVVDSGSRDGGPGRVRSGFPDVRLIELGTNVGFGRACNRAATEARGELLFFVNPDAVLRPGGLAELVTVAAGRPNDALFGSRAVDEEGHVLWNSCWGFPSLWSLTCFASGANTASRRTRLFDPESLGRWPRDTLRPIDAVTGYALLIRRAAWDRIAGFDERYFMYGEDIDLSQRAHAAGFGVVHVPVTTVTHFEGRSTPDEGRRMSLILRGKVTFVRAHWTSWRASLGVACLRTGVALRALFGPSKWRAVWHDRSSWSVPYPGPPSPGDSDATRPPSGTGS